MLLQIDEPEELCTRGGFVFSGVTAHDQGLMRFPVIGLNFQSEIELSHRLAIFIASLICLTNRLAEDRIFLARLCSLQIQLSHECIQIFRGIHSTAKSVQSRTFCIRAERPSRQSKTSPQ